MRQDAGISSRPDPAACTEGTGLAVAVATGVALAVASGVVLAVGALVATAKAKSNSERLMLGVCGRKHGGRLNLDFGAFL